MDYYKYQKPLGKIEDSPALRDEFIKVFDTKDKPSAVRFGIAYGKHLIKITGITPINETIQAFEAMQRWLDGKASYHEARNISFKALYESAREENNLIKQRFYKTMPQIACIPHVKFHALWASDFAITLINQLHPDNNDEVQKERGIQIAIFRGY